MADIAGEVLPVGAARLPQLFTKAPEPEPEPERAPKLAPSEDVMSPPQYQSQGSVYGKLITSER